jgi:hypothetical protein
MPNAPTNTNKGEGCGAKGLPQIKRRGHPNSNTLDLSTENPELQSVVFV